MEKMISHCGLLCHDCPAFMATIADDDSKRQEVATLWSQEYHADIKPEQINCFGCLSVDKPLFSHCNVCEIRACARKKNVENCAHCDEYICQKLDGFFNMVPSAKTCLDEIHAARK